MFVRDRALALLACSGLLTATLAPVVSAQAAAGPGEENPGDRAAQRAGGGWKKVSTGAVDSLAEITVARTADGVLHAVYTQDAGTAEAYEHSALSTSGSVIGHSDVLGTWGGLVGNPKLMTTPTGGLRLAFSGLQDTNTYNFYSTGYGYDTTSDASGTAWTLQPHALTRFGSVYAGYGTGATTLSNGTPVTAGTLNSDIYYRVGDVPTTDPTLVSSFPPDGVYTAPACCLYDTQLVNSGDAVWMAWYANGGSEATNGVFVKQIYPVDGAVMKAPGSTTNGDSLSADQAIAMVARPGGGVVLAYKLGYPTTKSIGLWEVGKPAAVKVPKSGGADLIALSTGVTGRMWLAWSTDGNKAYALRTSPSGFGLGAAQALGSPSGSSAIWNITVDASLNQGTVLVNDTFASSVFSRMVNPGLSLKVKPGSLKVGATKKITFTVTDAGAGVGGVKVKGGGVSCTTKASGRCTVMLKTTKAGKVGFKATKNGYGFAKASIRSTR